MKKKKNLLLTNYERSLKKFADHFFIGRSVGW